METEETMTPFWKFQWSQYSICDNKIRSYGLNMTLETKLHIAVEGAHRDTSIMAKDPG